MLSLMSDRILKFRLTFVSTQNKLQTQFNSILSRPYLPQLLKFLTPLKHFRQQDAVCFH
jgi:hypothetical protein